jgi:hypothetical protein
MLQLPAIDREATASANLPKALALNLLANRLLLNLALDGLLAIRSLVAAGQLKALEGKLEHVDLLRCLVTHA